MPLPLPNLDKLNFEDLMAEAKSLIPVCAPEWTNYNPSEPGITIIELFAWLCEMVAYRANAVPEKNYLRFLSMLGVQLNEGEKLTEGIRRGVQRLSECTRAVTVEDYEQLTCQGLMAKPGMYEKYPDLAIRSICLVNRDLEDHKLDEGEQFGHISVVIIIKTANQKDLLREMPEIKRYTQQYLSAWKLLTNRVHVVDPDYQEVRISMQVSAKDDSLKSTIKNAVERYLDPVTGGMDGRGWPVGRNLYNSDLFYLVEGMPGVDHVIRVDLETPALKPYQLIRLKELTIEVE